MKVLIVEDEVRVANFIRKGLREAGYAADIAQSAGEGADCMSNNEYDLVLLDWLLPDKPGIDLCLQWRKENLLLPVIMVTCRDATDDVVSALDNGVDDYIVKPFTFSELLARMRALLRRASTKGVSPTLKLDDLEVNPARRTVNRGETKIHLSEREFALLEYLLRNSGRVSTKKEILAQVWDIQHNINSNLVEVFINRLRLKLDCGSRRPLIHTLRGAGYLMKALAA
ncbi:MAG: response regulator transcription factor [bacterium]